MITRKLHSPFLFLLLVACAIGCRRTAGVLPQNEAKSKSDDFYAKGEYYDSIGKPDSAFVSYTESKEWAEAAGDSTLVAYILLYKISPFYKLYNDYNEYETVATEALSFIGNRQTATDNACRTEVHNQYGISYINSKNYKKALAELQEAYRYAVNPDARLAIQNNIAYMYMALENYPRAIATLEQLTQSKWTRKNQNIKAGIFDNLGYSYFRIKNPMALQYLQEAIEIRERTKDSLGLVAGYIHMSHYYQEQDRQLAVAYARRAYEIAGATKSTDDQIEALEFWMGLVSDREYRLLSQRRDILTDSIAMERRKSNNQFAAMKYDARKEKESNQKLQKQNLVLENRILLYFIGFIIVMLIGTIIHFRRSRRLRKEKEMESYRTETRIAKKVHDELANDMFTTLAFAESQDLSDYQAKEALLGQLDNAYTRARNISRENNPIDTGVGFAEQLRRMLLEYNNTQVSVIVKGLDEIDWSMNSEHKKISVYRVLQELMVNMKKHSRAGVVAIGFSNLGNDVQISYTDDGIGLPGDYFRNGLQNVENRITGIGGTFIFDPEPDTGLRITIKYPLKN